MMTKATSPHPEQQDDTSGAAPDLSDAVSEPQLMAGSADAADNTPEVEQESGSAEGTGDAAGPGNRKDIEAGQTAKATTPTPPVLMKKFWPKTCVTLTNFRAYGTSWTFSLQHCTGLSLALPTGSSAA